MKYLLLSSLTALLLAHPALSSPISIDGGLTWTGWNSVGQSNQLGVYGSGSTADIYEVYTTVFNFDNDSVSGTPTPLGGGPTGGATGFGTGTFSTGAFLNGNLILGIGIRRIGGAALTNFVPIVRFDLDNDSYQAASSVGGIDGQTSFNTWSEYGDFTIQFEGNAALHPWRAGNITMQAGNGSFYGTPQSQSIVGGVGSGVSYDFPFRAFAQSNSYQMFFDLKATSTLYGITNPFGLNASFTGIGAFPYGSTLAVSLNGLGQNNVAFGLNLPADVPEPASASLLFAVAVAFSARLAIRRRS